MKKIYAVKSEIKKEVIKTLSLCLEISSTTNHDAFFHYSPHVGEVEVHWHEDGWVPDKQWESINCYIEHDNLFLNISKLLQKYKYSLAEMKKINKRLAKYLE